MKKFHIVTVAVALAMNSAPTPSLARERQVNFVSSMCAYGTVKETNEGFVKSCQTAQNNGRGHTVSLHATNGRSLASRVVSCAPDTRIEFHDHGGVARCIVYSQQTLMGERSPVACRVGSTLYVSERLTEKGVG